MDKSITWVGLDVAAGVRELRSSRLISSQPSTAHLGGDARYGANTAKGMSLFGELRAFACDPCRSTSCPIEPSKVAVALGLFEAADEGAHPAYEKRHKSAEREQCRISEAMDEHPA